MKTILFALLGLFLITIFPVYAQEPSFDDRLVSSEEYTKLVTSDYILEQKITELQKTNSELKTEIENLASQITELKDHGIKFGIDEDKLSKIITNSILSNETDKGWTEGDILIGSTTIFAFFTFGSFITTKFESGRKAEQIKYMRFILFATFAVQIAHLYMIGVIVLNGFDPIVYIATLLLTIIALGLILETAMRIISAENREEEKKKEFQTDALIKAEDIFDTLRESKKKERESGE